MGDPSAAFREGLVLLSEHKHPFAPVERIDRLTISKSTLLMREQGSETRDLVLTQMQRHRYVPGRTIEVSSRDGVLQASMAGMGLAAVSLDEIDLPSSMRIVRFKGFRVFGVLHAVYLRRRAETRLISQFMRTVLPAASSVQRG
ncbi:MAG: LysR substrate-binding domain-containing protein [Burkholderiaceae bacterium]